MKYLRTCLLSAALAVTGAASPAHAQAPEPASPSAAEVPLAPPPVVDREGRSGSAVVAAPLPATPPPQVAPPPAPSADDAPLIRIYGFVKPQVITSFSGVETFSQPNASAVTAAANPVFAVTPDSTSLSFQVAESRLGFWVNEKGSVRAQIELDFIDFTKASPTVAALPRLRIAKLEWAPTPRFLLAFGQDWDLFSPLVPYGFHPIGNSFQAGNAGFMRHQLKLFYTLPRVELALALGLQGINNGAKYNSVEFSVVPTFVGRVTGLLGRLGRFGVSGLITQLRLGYSTPAEVRTLAFGGNVFLDLTPRRGPGLRLEGNGGRNLANLGALTLGHGTAAPVTALTQPSARDVDEVGGYLSLRQAVVERVALTATAGGAYVLNPENVQPSYQSSGSPAVLSLTGNGPGMRWNVATRAGVEVKAAKPLLFVLEGYFYYSSHVLLAADQQRWGSGERYAPGVELGAQYTF